MTGFRNFELNETHFSDLPEYFDNAFLNRHVQTGILRFYYETKSTSFLVYSSLEAKTFCMLMKLKPIHK